MFDKLFDIQKGNVVMNPTTLWIPEFKKVWSRDKSKDKALAHKEISYLVFKNLFNSPYMVYSEKTRVKYIMNDYFKDMPNWKPDKVVLAAEKRLEELQDSMALKLFRSTRAALELIKEYFDNADPSQIDKVIKNAKELGALMQSLNKLEEQVKKQQKEAASVRGEAEIGDFEL